MWIGCLLLPMIAAPQEEAALAGLLDLTELVCADCHRGRDGAEGAAALDLSAALANPSEHLEILTTAFAQVRQGFMPPSDALGGGFDDEDQHEWLSGLVALIARETSAHPSRPTDPGHATVRRMTRRQIERSLKRLLGIDVPVARFLPRDASGYGYDTTGDTLFVTPLSFESWYECVDYTVERIDLTAPAVAELALGFSPAPGDPAGDRERSSPRRAVERFLELAFSRPPSSLEVDERVEIGLAAGERSVHEVIRATLLSPGFLYRDHAPSETSVDGPTFALRASMFLHGARPTREVLRRAASGQFDGGVGRDALVDELLEDPASISLAEDFATQWLGTAELADVTPDVRRFRAFRRPLRDAMLAESIAFFEDLVRHNRSALLCIDSGHVFVNRHLAQHYGMEGVKGDKIRRVERQDSNRGGVLALAGVLTVTSNPLRTSPVKRGQWVLERLLHAPAPPPPPNAGTLPEDDQSTEGLTLREQLELHRASPACASCHDQMDPFGLALEAFDGIGKLRETEEGSLETTLADGTVIDGPAGLKAALLAKPERFLEALASNLFTYATGRAPTLVDLQELNAAVAECREEGFAIRSLIRGVALTTAMTHTRGAR